ncbi:MAG: hypothetical protein FJ319_03535 [SAR202 cluster bacterium]|nr:hypothetical protein [SAR202 cluster bacterium]
MESPFEAVVAYFETEHAGYFAVDEPSMSVALSLQGANGTYHALVTWSDEAQRLTFSVRGIITVPEDKRVAACVLANLINWSISIGNFELSMDDGELAMKLAFDLADGELGFGQINENFNSVLGVADHYAPAFHRLVRANLTPEEALSFVG